MRTIIAGGHGKIALRLERLLAGRGDEVGGLIRDPAQAADLLAMGAEPIRCDLEKAGVDEVAGHIAGADAVVFAAGAGPGSGTARKDTVDRAASTLLAEAAERAGVRRFVQISSMGAGRPPHAGADDVWLAYIEAKTRAEEELRHRALDWVIIRPGGLTDEPGTGLVTLGPPPVPPGKVTRDDVAAVVVEVLDSPDVRYATLELTGGTVPIREAIQALLG